MFDLGATIRFEGIAITLEGRSEMDQITLMLDGRLVE